MTKVKCHKLTGPNNDIKFSCQSSKSLSSSGDPPSYVSMIIKIILLLLIIYCLCMLVKRYSK